MAEDTNAAPRQKRSLCSKNLITAAITLCGAVVLLLLPFPTYALAMLF